MYKKISMTIIVTLALTSSAIANADSIVSVNYGTVQSIETTTEESSHAGGAVAGGLIGGLIGPKRHRGLRTVTGAVVGGAIQGSATGGTVQKYTVMLNNGVEEAITTEQDDIRTGDCVSIEVGDHANIRRVSSYHCETKNTDTADHHQAAASSCQMAKNELVKADTDDEIDNAAKKVRVLCED